MSNDVSKHFSSNDGTPDDFWERMKYLNEHKCCHYCNKENGRIIDDKYCSDECKIKSPAANFKSTGMV